MMQTNSFNPLTFSGLISQNLLLTACNLTLAPSSQPSKDGEKDKQFTKGFLIAVTILIVFTLNEFVFFN